MLYPSYPALIVQHINSRAASIFLFLPIRKLLYTFCNLQDTLCLLVLAVRTSLLLIQRLVRDKGPPSLSRNGQLQFVNFNFNSHPSEHCEHLVVVLLLGTP